MLNALSAKNMPIGSDRFVFDGAFNDSFRTVGRPASVRQIRHDKSTPGLPTVRLPLGFGFVVTTTSRVVPVCQWKDVRFVIRNIGGCSFNALSVTFSIPESEHEQTDVFQSAESGDLGLLDPGYAVQIPGPPKAIDYLWQRSLESSPDKRRFLNHDQMVIQAIESVTNIPGNWLFRFRFTELPNGNWGCERDLERNISDLRRIIISRTDSAPPQFGGDFFLEPKYK